MPRATNIVATHSRRKKMLKSARGYFGNKSRLFRYAKDAVQRAGKFAFRDRKKEKSMMRNLWIVRINAACRPLGISYSRLISGLKEANIELDRKAISELAIQDPKAFEALIAKIKA
ncbi:MAG: 50S ribosomal protein L20 [Verrucomicrobia bacterium GWF2_51_19]|nr:MAG: 50S ribosomal protein L20 [Verrucomicrobia bacterium GWF2_51_19]HCJ11582.1 50S ribosomal protein L20 [Opitutae bacterium]